MEAGGWRVRGEDSRKAGLATGANKDDASYELCQLSPAAFPATVKKWQGYLLPLLHFPSLACCSLNFRSALHTYCNSFLLGLQGSMEELMPGSVPAL